MVKTWLNSNLISYGFFFVISKTVLPDVEHGAIILNAYEELFLNFRHMKSFKLLLLSKMGRIKKEVKIKKIYSDFAEPPRAGMIEIVLAKYARSSLRI